MKPSILLCLLLVALVAATSNSALGQVDQATSTIHPGLSRGAGGVRFGDRTYAQPFREPATYSRIFQHRSSGQFPLGLQRRVPQDYATIQSAIDASSDGDTVLVSEGIYLENIRYRGKAITVASLYFIDGDTTHIEKTIIDGSGSTQADSGSVVYFVNGEDTTSVLSGLTIQGGTGTRTLYSVWTVWTRLGGGVYCHAAGARLVRNIIRHNRVTAAVAYGGGVEALATASPVPYVILEANRIIDNCAETRDADWEGFSGGADFTASARVVGNIFERDSVVGMGGAYGGGMCVGAVDTSIPLPEYYFAGNVFRSNTVSSSEGLAAGGGLVVFWTGNVTVQDNLFEGNSVKCSAQEGSAQGGGLYVNDVSITGYGRKMILKNRFLGNTLDTPFKTIGGALGLWSTLATVSANTFEGNACLTGFEAGAAISAIRSSFRIENNIITRNSAVNGAGGLQIEFPAQMGTEQLLINNTITANNGGKEAGGLGVVSAKNFVSLNNIFWNDTSTSATPEIHITYGITAFSFCDVEGGYPGTGNVNSPPCFVTGDPFFHLQPGGPCNGHGTDSVNINGVWYRAPNFDFDGNPRPMPLGSSPDIGAQEDQTVVGVDERKELPVSYDLYQNYPNPFNPTTQIRYEIPVGTRHAVSLRVYDVLGREVATLVNEVKQPGTYAVQFDASGLASGVYFYRLQAGSFVDVKKMLLVR